MGSCLCESSLLQILHFAQAPLTEFSMQRLLRSSPLLLLAVAALGCHQSGDDKSALPQPPAVPRAMPDPVAPPASRRGPELTRASAALSDDAKQLPGPSAAEHAKIVARVCNDLLTALPLLSDIAADRVMAERLAIIQSSRGQLSAGGALAIEPAIDTALRAANSALADISRRQGYPQAELGPMIDQLSGMIAKLDVDRDPARHRADVADAVKLMSQVVARLGATQAERLTSAPTTQP